MDETPPLLLFRGEGVHFTIANLPATQFVTRQPLPCGMVTRPWKLEPAVGSHQEDSLQNGRNAQMPYEKCQQMRQPLAERAGRDHLKAKATGRQSDSTLVSRKADRRNRETFVSTRAQWHEHVYDTTILSWSVVVRGQGVVETQTLLLHQSCGQHGTFWHRSVLSVEGTVPSSHVSGDLSCEEGNGWCSSAERGAWASPHINKQGGSAFLEAGTV